MPSPISLLTRRTGAVGVALTMYDLWRRLPPDQRRQVLEATRKHGTRLAGKAASTAARTAARKIRPPGDPKP
jgi:hypothetical protein